MSIQSEITRINNNVQTTLNTIAETGVEVGTNSDALPAAAAALANLKADKENGVFYIEGTSNTAGTWLGTHDDITEYYVGLKVAYKAPDDGSNSGLSLNINGLGAKSIRINGETIAKIEFDVRTVVFLTYSTSLYGDCWVVNLPPDTKVNYYHTTANNVYPVLFKYPVGNTATAVGASYVRFNNGIYLNPSTGVFTAPTFAGALTGNADTATKLKTARTIALTGDVTGSGTFDGSGNLTITTTCSGGGGGEAMTIAQIHEICGNYTSPTYPAVALANGTLSIS